MANEIRLMDRYDANDGERYEVSGIVGDTITLKCVSNTRKPRLRKSAKEVSKMRLVSRGA
jgi:hypothetical protein